jgi:multimeric flavodoxin WrbA
MLAAVLGQLESEGITTKLVEMGRQGLKGCVACYTCKERLNRRCVFDNDPVNEWIELISNSEGLLLGSPTYFSNPTASMQAFIERVGLVARVNGQIFSRKVAAAVTAVRRQGAVSTFDSMNHLFFANEMIVPGSNYWNLAIGKDPGDVESDEEGMETMRVLGRNMAWLLKKLHG